MRGTVEGLKSPYAFVELLPSVYQEDDFARRFVSGFDELLAPIVSVLDNVEAYFDPMLAPADFVEYLASWVGVELDETWSDEARRRLVATAVDLVKVRGTLEGLRRLVEIYTGVDPEILDGGGCAVSLEPNGPLPGSASAPLVVTVRVPDPERIDAGRLHRLVGAAKPAHVVHRVEVLPE